MAQAARLNLRMQKELKLLLTDPPPFASFPLLSPNSDFSSFSLSSILAQIEGPEDTVYSKGVFKINIQIPERYPFQPPIVTFATPVYHPNIDTGGRICLDILNLPPKGAWQPSLNISTVLTSILLLLSEPNPDDGLMCQASKEYKYNRQAFDQKARSMTEKYARGGATDNESGSQNTEIRLNANMMEIEGSELSSFPVNELSGTHETLSPRKKKLSLECSVTNKKKDNDNKSNEAIVDKMLQNQMEAKIPKRQSTEMLDDYQKHEKIHSTRRKLSLNCLGLNQKSIESHKENIINPQNFPVVSSESLLVQQDIIQYKQQSHRQLHKADAVKSVCDAANGPAEKKYVDQSRVGLQDNLRTVSQLSPANSNTKLSFSPLPMPMNTSPSDKQPQMTSVDRTATGFASIKHKRLGLAGRKQSLGLSTSLQSRDKDSKENMVPVSGVLLSNPDSGESFHGKVGNSNSNMASKKLLGIRRRQPLEPLGRSNGSNDDNIQLNLHANNSNGTPSESFSVADENRHSQKQLQQDNITTFSGQMKDQGNASPILDSVIVLDSEDSDEEKERTVRPKLALVRKRLKGKRNVKA